VGGSRARGAVAVRRGLDAGGRRGGKRKEMKKRKEEKKRRKRKKRKEKKKRNRKIKRNRKMGKEIGKSFRKN
jgi:hypothetical protein